MAILSSVRAGVGEPGRGCVSQIMKPKVVETCNNTSSAKPVLEIASWILRPVVEEHVLVLPVSRCKPSNSLLAIRFIGMLRLWPDSFARAESP